MASLLERLRQSVAREGLWSPGARVIAAVSGGADSVALVWLLHDLAVAGAITLVGLAHLNHRLRPDADADALFCAALAGRLGLTADIGVVDVAARARADGVSIEAAGRAARYAFLEDAATRAAAEAIAVAHTRDDQAETVLLRLLRGTGTTGLRGVLPRRGRVVRPLLDITRAELRAELAARAESWREDASNLDLATPRNRVRHELLPYLRTHFSAGVDAVLARTAEVARADEALLAELAASAFSRVATVDDGRVSIEATGLCALPAALRRRVARMALETAGGTRSYGLDEARAVVAACDGTGPGRVDLPGLRMERSGAGVVLLIRGGTPRADGEWPERLLEVPGEVELADGRRVVAASPPEGEVPARDTATTVVVDADRLIPPLTVRGRRPGDRVRPHGLGGRKKLQDLFVDRKVPRAERDRVPVVVDARGRVVWVVGHALDEAFRVTDRSGGVVTLTLVPSRK
ncbi:MAG: tRNA lysidine(34) synthetase TilS [Acidobacteriota bacterium]|nr:tRNA lysidine(34) synthetase TilS [Acidobacteriota bacterium]